MRLIPLFFLFASSAVFADVVSLDCVLDRKYSPASDYKWVEMERSEKEFFDLDTSKEKVHQLLPTGKSYKSYKGVFSPTSVKWGDYENDISIDRETLEIKWDWSWNNGSSFYYKKGKCKLVKRSVNTKF